ncbi:MAG: pilus assembly protein PilP [Candidatus Dactylopiibacterium sp.]|nr:pilus assembly protein PilP [Candidatus Dactylopiibacterium sp.]
MKRIWLLLAATSLLAACGSEEHEDLRTWMTQEAKGMQARIQPLPKLTEFPVVAYDATELSDPFQASRLEPEKRGGRANPRNDGRRREPLEAYPLESLQMVGMMHMAGKPVALVRADKNLFQIRAGNYLGQNFGVVTRITENELTLKELVEDANGDWIERLSTIQLQEQETKK